IGDKTVCELTSFIVREGRLSASRRNSKFPGLLVALCSCVRRCWRCLPSPTELRAVDPHPMQDHRKPTRQCNDGLFDPVPFGDIHRPRFQPRPFLDADQQDLRRFIKKPPQHAVAAQRDMTYSTALARLVEYGRQPQYSPHCSRMAEARRNVDRRGIGERDNRSDSGYRHNCRQTGSTLASPRTLRSSLTNSSRSFCLAASNDSMISARSGAASTSSRIRSSNLNALIVPTFSPKLRK